MCKEHFNYFLNNGDGGTGTLHNIKNTLKIYFLTLRTSFISKCDFWLEIKPDCN